MAAADTASSGAKHLPLGLSSGLGRSVVLEVDIVEQNVDESAPYSAGNGMASSTRLREWGLGEVGIGIFQMPWSKRSCLEKLKFIILFYTV